jgi:signal transduction histidine kinase/CheY-like chemotaxis protein
VLWRRRSARCASRNFDSEVKNKHCIQCGTPLRLRCPNCFSENPSEGALGAGYATALGQPADGLSASPHPFHPNQIESENAALAARCFRIVGTIVFLFQFLYFAADRAAMPQYQHFYLLAYGISSIDALLAIVAPRARWFPRYWKPLALVQVGYLDVAGALMNIFNRTVTPHFYTIITFSFGCATFLPWGVVWQSALNLLCLTTYTFVSLKATTVEPFSVYQWIMLLAVLILSEFPAAFIDQYRRRLFRQLEELTHALEELTQALKASRDKSEFLASMSHEMRTPLNTIIGMIEVLEGTEIRPEQAQYLNICRASGDALIALINDIVDISRIEAGELHLDHIGFDLYELIDHLADAMGLMAHRKGLELVFNVIQGTPIKLIGDPMRLRQVCSNLLVNAIKFTDKGQVVMRVETDVGSPETGALRFCVADTGVGIAPEEQKRIFSRFARTALVPGGQEGSGLGLEIAKRLVEAMGGRIWVESVPGMGSTFYFTCRLDVQSAGEREAPSEPRFAGTRVLVIDDNAASRSAIGEMLGGAGASVSFSSVSLSRPELIPAHWNGARYDVILLDFQMLPDIGSWMADERDPSDRDRTILMFTSHELPRAQRHARGRSRAPHLLKPIKRAELLDAVASVASKGQTKLIEPMTDQGPRREENLQGLRVLLAEDSEENRLLIAAYLRGTPHQLDTAENGRIAVEMFKTRRYDLLLVDVNMPVLDGYSAVASIRAWELAQGASPTPIVALTGRAMVEDRARAMGAGCNGYLTKPLRRAVLMEAMSHFTDAAPASATD